LVWRRSDQAATLCVAGCAVFQGSNFVQPVDRMVAEAREHVMQPGLGLEAVELDRSDQRVEDRGSATASEALT